MGAVLVWQNGNTDTTLLSGGVASLAFDVVLTENPTFPTQVADHVVEKGADISDNVRVGLRTLTLEVFVSNEPVLENTSFASGALQTTQINTPDTQQANPQDPGPNLQVPIWFSLPIGIPLVGALTSALGLNNQTVSVQYVAGQEPTKGSSINSLVLQFASGFDAVQQTHDLLDALRQVPQLIQVLGTKGTYDNMVIEHFEMTRNADSGSGAQFTIEMKEIRLVSTKVVKAPVPTKPRGNIAKSKGSQNTTSAPNGGMPTSLASKGLSLLQSLFAGQTTPSSALP